MPEYRAYIVGSDGHFRDAIAMNCDSDEAASKRADNLAKAETVEIELWQEARKVATFKTQWRSITRNPQRTNDFEAGRVMSDTHS